MYYSGFTSNSTDHCRYQHRSDFVSFRAALSSFPLLIAYGAGLRTAVKSAQRALSTQELRTWALGNSLGAWASGNSNCSGGL